MADYNRITMLGAGNLAWHLGPALENGGFIVGEVYNRHRGHAEALCDRLYNAVETDDPDLTSSRSMIFLFCVSDDAIESLARRVMLPEGVIAVHCSGSTPAEVLRDSGASATGVLYPVQTFTKGRRVDFTSVPFLVQSSDQRVRSMLCDMARAVSRQVSVVGQQQRYAVHLAAVMASNYSNHLYKLAGEILEDQGLDLGLLAPVIMETVHKAVDLGPHDAQTGPARRGDLRILDRHMEQLTGTPAAEMYRLMAQQILDDYPQDNGE